jgi:hypothetical protein
MTTTIMQEKSKEKTDERKAKEEFWSRCIFSLRYEKLGKKKTKRKSKEENHRLAAILSLG